MSLDGLNKINQTGNSSILTYDDIQTRTLNSIRIGNSCGKFLNLYNNVFIGDKAGLTSIDVEKSVFLGHNAGDNIKAGNKLIIIGYNYNSNTSNSITIGDNYTSTLSTSIGYNNYNYGNSNVIIGYNSSNLGNNIFTIGNDINVKSSKVYFHNGLNDNKLTNIEFNSNFNLLYDGYAQLYNNKFNSVNNIFQLSNNIQIEKKNLITDFILPYLKKECIIIQGFHQIIYNNSNLTSNYSSNYIFNNNQIFNLINTSSNLTIPSSIVRRIAIPRLDINTSTIFFNDNDGVILENPNDYKIRFLISTSPSYGTFKNNIVDNLTFDINNLIYISNNLFNDITDSCGITPFIIINNEYIKGTERILNFNRTFINYDVIPNPPITINFSKEIIFKTNEIIINVISFDYVYIKKYIIDNLVNITENEYANIIISVYEKPFLGFICDSNRYPIPAVNLNDLDNIIYQNYNNTQNIDIFKINVSYGYYYATPIANNLIFKINIITTNKIIYKDQYLFDILPIKNNIINYDYPTYVIDYSVNYNLIKLEDYYKYLNNKKNLNNITLKLITTNNNFLLFDNQHFYNYFGSLTFNIYNNEFISSNAILISNTKLINNNYQYLRYNINDIIINTNSVIKFEVMPLVLFPYIYVNNIYNFNLNFYNNNQLIKTNNYNNYNSSLLFNKYNTLSINIDNNYIINNIRFEFYITSNIINNPKLNNYITEIYFKNFSISYDNENLDNNTISIGKKIDIIGYNNIAIGSNINIIGNNSVVIGNDNSENPVYQSIIIGKNNFTNNYANNDIIIGSNNSTEIINSNQIIIGNNINNKFLLNIDDVICKDAEKLYLGLSSIPVVVGYDSNDDINLSDRSSLYIKDGLNANSFNFKNLNNCNITFKTPESLTSNIIYTLPILPSNFSRLMLTTDIHGNMDWSETNTFNIDTNLILNNIVANNLTVNGFISGDGSRLTNVNLSDKTTDDLIEGESNIYFTNDRASNSIFSNLNIIDSDYIKEGSNNIYYTTERDSNAFYSNLNNITTDNILQGSNNFYFNQSYLSNAISGIFNTYTTDSLREGSRNFYITQSRIDSYIRTRTTDDFREGSNNRYFTNQLALSRINIYLNGITTDNLREGSSNFYLTSNRLLSNINVILRTKTSDDIREGVNNLYYNQLQISNVFNNLLLNKNTNEIREGTSNLYLTFPRFNQYLSTRTTDNIREGTSNLYLTNQKIISILGTLNSDLIIEGTSNLYYKEEYGRNFFYKSLNLITTDVIREGISNKFIINNTFNSNLTVNGNIKASNVIIGSNNILDIYNDSINNLRSNYAKTYIKYTTTSNVSIVNNSTEAMRLTLNVMSNRPVAFANGGCPFIIVGSNVGINLLNPSYNLHVNGYAFANYFIGDGFNISNININNIDFTTDDVKIGSSNRFIINNIYDNNLTINGNLIYNNSIIKGDIIPYIDNNYKIGNVSAFISDIYVKKINLGNSSIYEDNSNFINFNTNNGIKIQSNDSNLQISFINNKLIFNSNSILDFDLIYNSPIIYSNNYNDVIINKPLYTSGITINTIENPFAIYNNNNPFFIINSNGNISINSIINDNYKLNVNGDINCCNIYINNNNIYDEIKNNSNQLNNNLIQTSNSLNNNLIETSNNLIQISNNLNNNLIQTSNNQIQISNNLNSNLIQTSNTLNNNLIQTSNSLNSNLIQTSNNLNQTSNNLNNNLIQTSNNLNNRIIETSNNLNNNIIQTSNNLNNNIIQISNTLNSNIIQTSNTLNSNIIQTSNTLNSNLIQTSNTLNNNINQTSNNLNNNINQTSNNLNSRIIQTSNTLNSNFIQTSNTLNNNINQTSNTLNSNIIQTSNNLNSRIIQTSNTLNSNIIQTSNTLNSRITQTSNTLFQTSNTLNSRIIQTSNNLNILNTDTIQIGSSNRFITNNTYDHDITFTRRIITSNITTSNLNIIGSITTISTSNYQTEQIQIINDSTATPLMARQINFNKNVVEFYNDSELTFIVSSNANVGIGNIYPSINYKLDVNGSINCTDLFIKNINILNNINQTSNNLNNNINQISNNLFNNINLTSNILNNNINQTSNILNNNINQTSNNLFNTSNILNNNINQTSNILNNNINLTSNILNNNINQTSNILNNNINQTSNILNNNINQTSNILNNNINLTSNILNNNINQTSNNLFNNIHLSSNVFYNNVNQTSNNLLNTSNILYNNINQISNNLYNNSNSNIIQLFNTSNILNNNIIQLSNVVYSISTNNTSNILNSNNIVQISTIFNSNIIQTSNILYSNSININNNTSNILNSNIIQLSTIFNSNIIQTSNILYSNSININNNTSNKLIEIINNNNNNNNSNLQIINNENTTAFIVKQNNNKHQLVEFYNNNYPALIITSNSRIGIGKSNPKYKIDVDGDINCTQLFINDVNISSIITGTSNLNINFSNLNNIESNIIQKLNINTDTIKIGTSNRFITNDNYDRDITFSKHLSTSNLSINNYYSSTTSLIVNQMNNTQNIAEFYNDQHMAVVINSNGNVGINVINPRYDLDVGGDINCTNLNINNENLLSLVSTNINYTSNALYDYTTNRFIDIRNGHTYAYNSTLIDFTSIISSNVYTVSSSNFYDTHYCVYHKNLFDSELLIQADFPYIIDGYGSDHYASRLSITTDVVVEPEYSLEHEQIFVGYASGGGTRSTTLSPINHKTAIAGDFVTIKVQLRLVDSDDSLTTKSCVFIITEKKPSSKLQFSKYIEESDVLGITSNIYVNQEQLTSNLLLYQKNDYGKWLSNTSTKSIYYNYGYVGIGKTNPLYHLDVDGNINCSGIYVNNNNVITSFDNTINQTSNSLFNYASNSFSNVRNHSTFAYNSTIIDFQSHVSYNTYVVNSSSYSATHVCTYYKNLYDSELLIQADFPYTIDGYGSDHYASRLSITSELITSPEYSLEHEQIFIGYASGGGTRSTTLSPINHKTEIVGNIITIKVEIRLVDSDDSLTTNSCVFIITEKKPTSKLLLTKYIDEKEVVDITSNLYINPSQLSTILSNYQTNDYGKWLSNVNTNTISYDFGNVSIGVSNINADYKLDVNGNINCSAIYINNNNILTVFNSNINSTSNTLFDYTTYSFSNLRNFNTFAYNSTVIDFHSIISHTTFVVNSSNYTDTHTCTYNKNLFDSELLIQADFPYIIDGFGTDNYASRLSITSELVDEPEYSLEHEQVFIGYAAGGGTRSTTLSPICHKTDMTGNLITIKVQIKLIDSDDSLTTNSCVFIITEKKPTSKLRLTKYIDEKEVVEITSNLYIKPIELSTILNDYQTNDYGKWISNINTNSISYNLGNIGIGVINPNYKLDVNGNINCSAIYINNNNLVTNFNNNITQTSNSLFDYTTHSFSNVRNYNTFAFNSTVIDFYSFVSSNNYVVNSSNYTATHYCIYNKNLYDSELLIQADFPYIIDGFGSDHYASRLSITSELIDDPEYSIEHEQVFVGYASGGGTRSTTLSPINHKTAMTGNIITIKVEIRLVDSDDSLRTNSCVFIITEKKPTAKLLLTKYIDEKDVVDITSNLYVSPNQLSTTLNNYQTNNYGKWSSNINNKSIYYNLGNVGIGVFNPNYNLDVNGNINCDAIYVNNNNLLTSFNDRIYQTSNYLFNYTATSFSNVRNHSTFAYNSTVIDFYSFISSNNYIVNSSNYTSTHYCIYHKKLYDSELLIQADFPYIIDGFGSDHYASRLSISTEEIEDPEYSIEHEQVFIGYASGGGTRSTTLSPINHKTAIMGNTVLIKVEIKLVDSDDSLSTNSCVFIITEKKPTSKLLLTKYIDEKEVVDITSNLYINPLQLSNILNNYQTNNYGKWVSNVNTNAINYEIGNVGIGITNINPLYKLNVNGNINCSDIYLNNENLETIINHTSNILIDYTDHSFDNARNFNTFAYNSTVIDFNSFISSNVYVVNSSNFITTHYCTYHKKLYDSELLIQADFPYIIDGFGSDIYASRLNITSEEIANPEFSIVHEQVFIGYASGGGTRSTTLSPITHTTTIRGNIINIKVEIRLVDSDDNLTTNSCIFIITEKKPSSKLILTKYIEEKDVVDITSNLYINPTQFSNTLSNYQTNNYGKWNCNNSNIYFSDGFVGIGTDSPKVKLHVYGNIVSTGYITTAYSDIRLKNITSPITNALEIINNINGFKYKHNEIAKSYGYNDDDEHIGINAQEVSNFIPEIVSLAPFDIDRNEDGVLFSKSGNNYLTVQYDKIIPYLIESIKELKKENEKLNNRIKTLENMLF